MTTEVLRVDRESAPPYPRNVAVLHQDLELLGPNIITLSDVEEWLHPVQKHSKVLGKTIYNRLLNEGSLVKCFGLSDLLALQKLDTPAFRQHFGDKMLFGWKSIARKSSTGRVIVPYLTIFGQEIVQDWFWVGHGFTASAPSLRFKH